MILMHCLRLSRYTKAVRMLYKCIPKCNNLYLYNFIFFLFIQSEITYHPPMDEGVLYKTLKNECEPPVMFAINRNLYAYVKITNCKYEEINATKCKET